MKVLDHGYVDMVETWGSDASIVEAARMSTGKGFLGWGGQCKACQGYGEVDLGPSGSEKCPECNGKGNKTGDEKLLRFLYEHKHSTPFEMGGMIIEVQAPIFVFREWHRHRTQSFNEASARYSPLPDLNYIPTVDRLMMGTNEKNKQAGVVKGAETLTIEKAELVRSSLSQSYEDAERLYQDMLMAGVPKELARIHLPVGRYSRMRASANLRNWLGFLTLRTAEDAQWEIRQYAKEVCNMISRAFPRTHALFVEGLV